MKRSVFLLLVILFNLLIVYGQSNMRIHNKSGNHSDIPIEKIDSITFVDRNDATDGVLGLTGGWLWGDADAGYNELLTFNENKMYTCYVFR